MTNITIPQVDVDDRNAIGPTSDRAVLTKADQPQGIAETCEPRAGVTDPAKAMALFVMIVAILYFGREMLVPIVLALLLAFILAPLVAFLRRLHLGHVPSVFFGLVLALAVILTIGTVIGSQVAQLSDNLPQYIDTIETKVDGVRAFTVGRLSDMAARVGSQRAKIAGHDAAAAAPEVAASALPAPFSSMPPATGSALLELAQRYISPVLSPLVTLGLIFVVAIFALLQQEDLRDRLIRLFGADDPGRTTFIIDDVTRRLSKYFRTQLSVNTAFGLVVGTGLLVIGVPNPVLFGILSALLRFVPYIGSLVAALLPMALGAAVDPGWSLVLWTALLYLVVESATGQVIEPLIYAHSTGLSPFSVVVAAIVWSWLWGPIGLILSIPLTMGLVVIGQHVARLKFLDTLLGDRPK
ncbi:AI-2E family transporter [Lichenifustis flavocetrariae]|uniref:AI-2E family transporter n=1 Tax=Lichenifustis flavocetrariae TaxID=2949735 RepID=A0AA42CK50_9HYPH|nr:AI-2E family transporter [Lichenifustis flavocetrariae]MCW6508836.1 AI-2E family transporter [Lichenifustis flavocetrariae]